MTDKELQKLGRRELLQMLLEQAKEAERLGALLKESEEKYRELEARSRAELSLPDNRRGRLRKLLGPWSGCIRTVFKTGYKWEP